MTLSRRIGLGVTIGVNAGGTATTYTTLGAVVDGVKDSGSKADVADISVLSDTFKPKAKGQIDPGEATITIAWDPDDTTSTVIKTLHDSTAISGYGFQILLPSGTGGAGTVTAKTFSGFVTGCGREIMKDKMITQEVTITKSGDPGV